MPSSQKQIIGKTKFAHFPLGRAFEKQIKKSGDQGEKQIKEIENNKKQLDNKKQLGNNELLPSKKREIFKNIYSKRLD